MTTHPPASARSTAGIGRSPFPRFILAGAFLLMAPFGVQAAYEPPPTLRAADVLPPDWLRGTHFRIDGRIPTDGFLTHVTIYSDYGTFEVEGPGILGVRLREIDALAALDQLENGGEFVTGIKGSASNTGENIHHLTVDTEQTLGGIPEGIQRFFQRSYRSAKTGVQTFLDKRQGMTPGELPDGGPGALLPGGKPGHTSPAPPHAQPEGSTRGAGKAAAKALGFDDARRDLAKRLGVDPYTTNPVLAARLDDVAWAAFAGHLSIRLATMLVPGGFILSTSNNLTDWVWDARPGDLRLQIEGSLIAMGIDQDSVDRLLRHRWYSLSLQAALTWALEQLEGVRGRSRVMPLALSVTSEAQARYVVQTLLMTGRAHRLLKPLDSIDVAWTVVARDRAGELLVAAPVDYLSWNPTIEKFVQRQAPAARRRTLHVAGLLTAYARLKLEQYGWDIAENSSLFMPVLGYREMPVPQDTAGRDDD